MSNLFNYLNTNLTTAVIEGYPYSMVTGRIDTTPLICYVVDKVDIQIEGNETPVQVYITILIDPTYTTYTSIQASNLILTQVVYIPAKTIKQVIEFPETNELVSKQHGLSGAAIKGYEYSTVDGRIGTSLLTCRIIDQVSMVVDGNLRQLYVCVLYTSLTGQDKIYIPVDLVREIVEFPKVDPGHYSVLRYTDMNFVKDDTATTILFKDSTTGNILRAEPINSIQAVANGTDIRIQKSGGTVILIDALDITTTYIDGVVVTAVLATAVNELNSLYALTTGAIGKLPTITSGDILLTAGNPINYFVTGDNIASVDYDLTGLPAATLTTPLYNQFNLIGGTLLPVGNYTFTVHCFNYWGQTSKVINISVASSYSNTYSYEGNSLSYFQKTAVGSENDTPLYRPTGATGSAWTLFSWLKSNSSSGSWRSILHFGDFKSTTSGTNAGCVRVLCRTSGGNIQLYFFYGIGLVIM